VRGVAVGAVIMFVFLLATVASVIDEQRPET
jgi:hypothetical protein